MNKRLMIKIKKVVVNLNTVNCVLIIFIFLSIKVENVLIVKKYVNVNLVIRKC